MQPQAAIEALIALARAGDKSLQPKIIAAPGRLDFAALPAKFTRRGFARGQAMFTATACVLCHRLGSEQIERTDGDPIVGRVAGEENGELLALANPFSSDDKVRMKAGAGKSRKPFATSLMPAGLISSLNAEELQDLLA